MLGRGDIVLYSPPPNLLKYETEIREITSKLGCRYYVATDFLLSMVNSRIPSRSDLIDLEYALKLGIDGIVLNMDLVISKNLNAAIDLINDCIV